MQIAERSRSFIRRAEPVLFCALVAVHLAALWAVAFVPTQDGPAHVANAMALLRRNAVPALSDYYELNARLVPNWLGHGLLGALLTAFPPRIAEKILLSGYALGLPLAFRYALSRRAREAGLSLAVFPFLYGFTFHMGFTGFSLSLVFAFVALGVLRRSRGRFSCAGAAALGALGIVVALGHPVTFAALGASVAAFECAEALRLVRATHRGPRRARVVRMWARAGLTPLLALAPGAALVGAFAIGGAGGTAMRWLPLSERVFGLLVLRSLATLGPSDLWIAGAFAAVVVVGIMAAAWVNRDAPRGWGWVAAIAVATALAVAAPNEFGAGWPITPRLQLFPYALALIWLGEQRIFSRIDRAIPVAGASCAVLLLASHAPTYERVGEAIEEYASVAPFIERGSTFLPLQLTLGYDLQDGRWVPEGFKPFLHAAGYVAAERDAVDLANYEAATDHFPLRFRENRDPFVLLGRGHGIEGEMHLPCLDLDAARPPVRIDYVILWGPPGMALDDACVVGWYRQLLAKYTLVYVSKPRGFAQLWRRGK